MKVWRYGDGVNTDMLFPGKYTYTCATAEEILPHLLEDLDAEFATGVSPGDIVLAGSNFGCGSSREQPPQAVCRRQTSDTARPGLLTRHGARWSSATLARPRIRPRGSG